MSIIKRDILFYAGEVDRLQADLRRCVPGDEGRIRHQLCCAQDVLKALKNLYASMLED